MTFEDKAEVVISQLREDRDKLQNTLKQIRSEIEDARAYEQEAHGKTEFLKGINYCLSIFDKYKEENLKDTKTDDIEQIKSEIEEVFNDRPNSYNHSQRRELFCKVIEILDKHKEDKEEDKEIDR